MAVRCNVSSNCSNSDSAYTSVRTGTVHIIYAYWSVNVSTLSKYIGDTDIMARFRVSQLRVTVLVEI